MGDKPFYLNPKLPKMENPSAKSDYRKAVEKLSQSEKIELDGKKLFFELRNKWSNWIIAWITIFIVFQAIFIFLIGFFDPESYRWLVPIVIGENFLQILGMGYIITNFLYPRPIALNASYNSISSQKKETKSETSKPRMQMIEESN